MSLDKFWLQSNNGKQIDLQNLKELKKSDLGNNNALIQLFNIFDTQKTDGTAGSDGVLNKSELTSLFNTFNAASNSSNGMSKSVFESNEAEEYLNTTKTTSGKTLSEIGVKANDVFEFLSKFAQNSNAPVNVNNVANDVQLTEEQAQEEVISTISEDTANARTLLMKQDNGHISQLYNKAKELFDSDLSLSNVEEAFMLQEECLENLSKAKEGKLSKREYFLQNREHLKAMMKRRLFRKDENTGLDFLDNNRGKMSKQEFAKLMEDYINEKINEIDRLDSLNKIQHSLLTMGASGVNNVLKKYQKAAQNKQITDFSVESKSAKLPSKTSAIPQKYNTTEPMTFKEVFEIERNQEYSKDRVEAYISQKQKTDFAVGAYNKYQSFKMNSSEILNDYTKSVAGTYTFGGGMAAGVQPNPEKQMQKVLEAFESYYANPIDPNSARNEIETLVKDNRLPISVIQDSNGKLSLDLSKLKTNAEKNNVLNKLLKFEDTKLEAKLKTTLGGEVDEMLEMLSTNTQNAFTNAYGHDFTNELVQEMSEDNKTVIQRYTSSTSQIGMGLTVVGGVLCFTPLAGVGATMVGIGNTMAISGMVAESALGFEEALSRSNLNPEEIKELSKTLVMNAGGFVVGYKAGQTGMKAFNKLIDKKLAEVFKTEMANGNRAEALKQVFSNPEYLKNFMQAAGVKLSADFMISYAGDLAMMGILDTNDDWKSLLQSNLIGIITSMGGDLKNVANLGIKGNKAKTIQKDEKTNNKAKELTDLHNDIEMKNTEEKSGITENEAISMLVDKIQKKTNVFELRELIPYIKNRRDGAFIFVNNGTRYRVEYNSKGDITGFTICKNKETSYYNYDSSGNALKINRTEYYSTGTVPNADYILSKQEIPEDIAKLMFENDYAFAKDDIDAMINLIKDEKDWAIVKKILSTKGSPTTWKRAVGNLIGASTARYTAQDLLAILKSDEAKDYVKKCIKNNRYCNKDKISNIVNVAKVSKTTFAETQDLNYQIQDITLNNIVDVIKEYNSNPDIKEMINKKIPDGEIGNINGQIFCRNGDTLIKINMSKNTFETLFPISERYNIKQGNIGDCWLISDICGIMSTPEGRANIYSLFREENGNIFVKLPNNNIEVCFNLPEWKKLKTDGLQKASDGIRMLEQTLAFNRYEYSDKPVIKQANNSKEINKALKTLEGGQIGEGISYLIPQKGRKHCMYYGVEGNSAYKSLEQQKNDLDVILNEIDTFLQSNQNAVCPITFSKGFTLNGYRIEGSHACRLIGYNKSTQCVKFVNPHNGNQIAEIPLDIFVKTAKDINLYDITTKNKTYNFSAKKLNQDGAIYL